MREVDLEALAAGYEYRPTTPAARDRAEAAADASRLGPGTLALDVGAFLGVSWDRPSYGSGTNTHFSFGLRLGARPFGNLPLRAELSLSTDSIARSGSIAAVEVSPWRVESFLLVGLDRSLFHHRGADFRLQALVGPGLAIHRVTFGINEKDHTSWGAEVRGAAQLGMSMRYRRFRLALATLGSVPFDPLARLWLGGGYAW